MYKYIRKLLYPVRVRHADPAFGHALLGPRGVVSEEFACAAQYTVLSMVCGDARTKRLLLRLSAQAWSELELAIALAHGHLRSKPSQMLDDETAITDLVAVAGHGSCDAIEHAWMSQGRSPVERLRSHLGMRITAAECLRKDYESLIGLCIDADTRELLRYLSACKTEHIDCLNAAIDDLQVRRRRGKPEYPEEDVRAALKAAEHWQMDCFYR